MNKLELKDVELIEINDMELLLVEGGHFLGDWFGNVLGLIDSYARAVFEGKVPPVDGPYMPL